MSAASSSQEAADRARDRARCPRTAALLDRVIATCEALPMPGVGVPVGDRWREQLTDWVLQLGALIDEGVEVSEASAQYVTETLAKQRLNEVTNTRRT